MSFLSKQLIKEKIKRLTFWDIVGIPLVSAFWGYLAYTYIYSLIYDTKETIIGTIYLLITLGVIYGGMSFHKILNEKERIEWNKYKGLLGIVNGIGIIMFGSLAFIGVNLFKYIFYSNPQMGYVALYSAILFLFSMVTYFALVYKFNGAINLLRGYLIIATLMILSKCIPFIYYKIESYSEIAKYLIKNFEIIIICGIFIALVLKGLIITTNKRILVLYSNGQMRFINILILTFIGFILILPLLLVN